MPQHDDFTDDLIKSLNKSHGTRVAYNLALDDSPTHVKRWISTGSRQLDYIISNRRGGGLPEGRIVEIFGPPSIGKSHIAIQIARSTQKMGGIVVYIDTENATSVENLGLLGVDVKKRFVYVDTHCTEEVLSIAEETILKAKAMKFGCSSTKSPRTRGGGTARRGREWSGRGPSTPPPKSGRKDPGAPRTLMRF